jgi:Fur family ferric uptake transcriptional regulator
MSCEAKIYKQLRERGFRLTPQREMVLSVMHDIGDFATVEEIHCGVQKHSSSVDISTVYRTLDLLQDFRVIATVDLGDGQRRYRLSAVDDPEIYLVCRECGAISDVDIEQIESCIGFFQDRYGFELELDHLSLQGLCKACRVAQSRTTASA